MTTNRSVGRAFSGAVVETSLSSYPGTFFTSAPSGAQGVARYWPTTVAATVVEPRIVCDGEEVRATTPGAPQPSPMAEPMPDGEAGPDVGAQPRSSDLVRVPLWVLVGARSGDKGGDANVGVWADEEAVAAWLGQYFSTEVFKALLPEVEPYTVSRYPLPNLWAVNFVVHGLLGWGVASNLRLDTQAKGLGELLRSRLVDVPASLVATGGPAGGAASGLTPTPAGTWASGRMARWRRSCASSPSSRASRSWS